MRGRRRRRRRRRRGADAARGDRQRRPREGFGHGRRHAWRQGHGRRLLGRRGRSLGRLAGRKGGSLDRRRWLSHLIELTPGRAPSLPSRTDVLRRHPALHLIQRRMHVVLKAATLRIRTRAHESHPPPTIIVQHLDLVAMGQSLRQHMHTRAGRTRECTSSNHTCSATRAGLEGRARMRTHLEEPVWSGRRDRLKVLHFVPLFQEDVLRIVFIECLRRALRTLT